MALLAPSLLLALGIIVLVKGADRLVAGSSSLARRLGVSELAIGLTIVAFGTSAPELAVNVLSSVRGLNGIVFGNIIGSNIFNILVILGVAGLVHPLAVRPEVVRRDLPFSLLATLVLWALVSDAAVGGSGPDVLSRDDGLVLLGLFAVFLAGVLSTAREGEEGAWDAGAPAGATGRAPTPSVEEPPSGRDARGMVQIWGRVLVGLAALFIGGRLVVDGAVAIARELAVGERLIALTIVAGGTSLPELATSVVAARQRRFDIAVGNVVGSNVFNVLFILGVSALVRPAPFEAAMGHDLSVLALASLLLLVTMFTGEERTLDRWEAGLMLVAYAGYLASLAGML